MAFSPDTALKYLGRAYQQNRLAHAYLFSGPPGSGKRSLAARLVGLINKTAPEDVFSTRAHEVFVAEPGSKSRRIVIEQIRNLEHALHMRASSGRRKVAIIPDADRLQPQAANAFLKTLEEPPGNSLLLLLSALPEVLPDTVLSRCIEIPLAAPEDRSLPEQGELIELLRKAARDKTWSVQQAYRLAQGLQRVLNRIRDDINTQHAEALKLEETRYKNSTDGKWLEAREEYYKALTESVYLQRRTRLIELLFVWWSDILRAKSGVSKRDLPSLAKETDMVAARFSTAEILRRLRRLEQLRDHLDRNIQEALAIEVALLNIFGR
jgi:DNA polymerase III subunit delta'